MIITTPVAMGARDLKVKKITYPRTRVAHVQVVPPLFRGELGAGLPRDEVAERALLALELARLVAGLDPVRDLGLGCFCGGCLAVGCVC